MVGFQPTFAVNLVADGLNVEDIAFRSGRDKEINLAHKISVALIIAVHPYQ